MYSSSEKVRSKYRGRRVGSVPLSGIPSSRYVCEYCPVPQPPPKGGGNTARGRRRKFRASRSAPDRGEGHLDPKVISKWARAGKGMLPARACM